MGSVRDDLEAAVAPLGRIAAGVGVTKKFNGRSIAQFARALDVTMARIAALEARLDALEARRDVVVSHEVVPDEFMVWDINIDAPFEQNRDVAREGRG